MNELTKTVSMLSTSSLAALLELSRDTADDSSEAKQESLEHLLTTPVERAVNQLPRELADRLRPRARRFQLPSHIRKSGVRTFGELLRHPQPSLEMLRFAKDFVKTV